MPNIGETVRWEPAPRATPTVNMAGNGAEFRNEALPRPPRRSLSISNTCPSCGIGRNLSMRRLTISAGTARRRLWEERSTVAGTRIDDECYRRITRPTSSRARAGVLKLFLDYYNYARPHDNLGGDS